MMESLELIHVSLDLNSLVAKAFIPIGGTYKKVSEQNKSLHYLVSFKYGSLLSTTLGVDTHEEMADATGPPIVHITLADDEPPGD
jgi:hypothetical protein